MPGYMDDFIKQIKKKNAQIDLEGESGKESQKAEEKAPAEPLEQEKPQKEKKAEPELFVEEREPPKKTPLAPKEPQKPSLPDQSEISGKTIAEYGQVKIFKVPKEPLLVYTVPSVRPTETEKTIINTIKEAATRLITIAPFRIRDPQERKNIYTQKVMEILQNSPQLKIPQRRWEFYASAVVREMVGYGPIDPLVNDDGIEEIMVIGPKLPVYIFHRKYEMLKTNIEFYSDQEINDLINRIARQIGRRVDISSPMLDSRLADGSRVNATIPPASVDGSTLTIRKFRKDPYSLIDLINEGTINSYVGAFLWTCVDGMGIKPANMLISGGTGSGKTTSLNALAAFIPPYERVITIEDTAELSLPLKHWIRLEGKPPGIEGKGEITLDILTKNSLRMRPDRIIVGEIRHAEAFTLFTALNTGHQGAVTGDTIIQLSDGNLVEIKDLVEECFEKKNPRREKDFEVAEIADLTLVPSLNKKTLKIENKQVTHVWRKKGIQKLKKIRLKSGKTLKLTEDHPIYRIQEGIQEINSVQATKGDFIAIPKEIKVGLQKGIEEAYVVGLILGDGHIRTDLIEFTNKNDQLHKIFGEKMQKLTKNRVIKKTYKNFSRTKIYDTKLASILEKEYFVPKGNKTKTYTLNKMFLQADEKNLAEMLSGLFDSDGSVNTLTNSIVFATANKEVGRKMPIILQRFGIKSSTYLQKKDGKGHPGPYYIISIYGKENLEKFQKKIGLKHSQKSEKLEKIIAKSKNSFDLFPNISKLIRNIRLESGMTQLELSKLLGNTTPSVIESYETKARKPSREQLEKILSVCHESTLKNDLKLLIDSDLHFEEIVSIEEETINETVYDLTVQDNHNYIVNGVIISNCMGTVHANSSYETVIRVISPPMDVPEVMLAGLDFVLVEHRLHDRKKGTIRRFTEIAEVRGAMEKKTKTVPIFEYDPATDNLKRTKNESEYIKTVARFLGKSPDAVEKNISKREKFLNDLVEKDIHSMEEVSKKCLEFMQGSEREKT